jgi:hypothetical protein
MKPRDERVVYHRSMLALSLLASAVLIAGDPIPPHAWVEPQQSFRTIAGFRIRVDVHAEGQFAAMLGKRAHVQIERSLRLKGIHVAETPSEQAPALDGIGMLVLDVHVLEASDGTAVAWSLNASQIVHLITGEFASASTWEVGDLLYTPTGATAGRLHASLQPALDELCDLYLTSRATPPSPPAPEATPSDTDL